MTTIVYPNCPCCGSSSSSSKSSSSKSSGSQSSSSKSSSSSSSGSGSSSVSSSSAANIPNYPACGNGGNHCIATKSSYTLTSTATGNLCTTAICGVFTGSFVLHRATSADACFSGTGSNPVSPCFYVSDPILLPSGCENLPAGSYAIWTLTMNGALGSVSYAATLSLNCPSSGTRFANATASSTDCNGSSSWTGIGGVTNSSCSVVINSVF